MKLLKNKFFILASLAILSVSVAMMLPNEKEDAIDRLLVQCLENMHYAPQSLNDNFSKKVFATYIKRLDYTKKFLIQSDVDELKKYELLLDDEIKDAHFDFFEKSIETIQTRIDEAKIYYKELLEKPFDFTQEETIELDAEKQKFAKTKNELKDQWRKSLKYQVLAKIFELEQNQIKAKEKSDTVLIKTKDELETDARKKVLKSNDDYFKRLKDIKRSDRISAYFNSITAVYDPHTEYFAPKDKANFDIGMTGQLEGIGAQLQEKDGFIKVTNIVPGSASYKQGQLKAGDIILKVAQGSAEAVDIEDMRLDDAVQLIRGKKGTEVKLTVKKPDGSTLIIPLIRDIVVIEETYAQSVILKGKRNIGYIKLPSFYADFSGANGGKSCARDVRKELEKLKEEKIDGVILDLRYNGGGSLQDAVDMAGLFFEKGPVVQVKQRSAVPQVLEDRDPSIVYNGPLTIMVNENSASASEILAAAIQDYKRGLIVGTSPSTFGKGTVQRFIDLDDMIPNQLSSLKPLGQVKVTIQKFYRINGGATQLKGVTPDILLPDPYYLLDQGEKEQDYPMPWDEINAAKYSLFTPSYTLEKIKTQSQLRVKQDKGFNLLEETAKRLKKQKDISSVSLHYDKFMNEQKKIKEENNKLEELNKETYPLQVEPLKVDWTAVESDTTKTNKLKEWHKNIKKDIYLNETYNIINDIK
jgi:carboxyl-terminal processing protease